MQQRLVAVAAASGELQEAERCLLTRQLQEKSRELEELGRRLQGRDEELARVQEHLSAAEGESRQQQERIDSLSEELEVAREDHRRAAQESEEEKMGLRQVRLPRCEASDPCHGNRDAHPAPPSGARGCPGGERRPSASCIAERAGGLQAREGPPVDPHALSFEGRPGPSQDGGGGRGDAAAALRENPALSPTLPSLNYVLSPGAFQTLETVEGVAKNHEVNLLAEVRFSEGTVCGGGGLGVWGGLEDGPLVSISIITGGFLRKATGRPSERRSCRRGWE
mmetsp:Transcript_42267/g.100274  ORF Transcript_42267/g.100274 Transcript_42267/m.100274 type:complete len:280 (-) Transcript_42267:96-935(-)